MPENLFTHPIHLGLGAKALAQPAFTGMEWYEAYSVRHAADGAEGGALGGPSVFPPARASVAN